eukprot:2260984-Prymnesium_polylepis.2
MCKVGAMRAHVVRRPTCASNPPTGSLSKRKTASFESISAGLANDDASGDVMTREQVAYFRRLQRASNDTASRHCRICVCAGSGAVAACCAPR